MAAYPGRFRRTAILAGLTCSLLLAALQASEESSPFKGRVLDPARAPIAGATITVVGDDGVVRASAHSGAAGEFAFPLDPGGYTLRIVSEGFQEEVRLVRVPLADPADAVFVLRLAARREMVTVIESAGYRVAQIDSGTKTHAPLRDIPQAVSVITRELISDQMMSGIADAVRFVPGITAQQGEGNRDQLTIRGNTSTADFFVNGVRDDVQYFRDLYNLERVEALKGPNAMIFGRGGGGGVINRVTKEPAYHPMREISLLGGSFGNKRLSADANQPLGSRAALRLNGMYEDSGSFRDQVSLKRHGVSPSLSFAPSASARLVLGYEHFRDDRTADRGIPSYQGRPAPIPSSAFFGNPRDSHAGARVNTGSALFEWQAGRLLLRHRVLAGDYDRGYQNFVPGSVTADLSQAMISAYNSSTHRRNVFNQTDLILPLSTGRFRHSLLAGFEAGRQSTDNLRNTGYFNNSATSILVPVSDPVTGAPVTFRQSATDADNRVTTWTGSAYVQDQVSLTRRLRAVAGIRIERFDLQYHNRRTGEALSRLDNLVSPRAGLVFKPSAPISLYTSYSVSYLPSSGDQFSSLTAVTQQMKPEKFHNYEAGLKWDLARGLSLNTAVYRLDRTNTRSVDANDPSRILQTGEQRSNGFELGWNGRVSRFWSVAGGYAWQDVFISRDTASARAGLKAAQAPRHSFSLWNYCQIHPRLGAALGLVSRSSMYAGIDNTVLLPGYVVADGAVFFSLRENLRLQVNVENLAGRNYYLNAHSNNNISPGRPRSARLGLTARF